MTTQETIAELRAEIEELKAQKELELVKEELENLKYQKDLEAPREESDEHQRDRKAVHLSHDVSKKQHAQDVKVAAVRQTICGLTHFLGGPIASIVYGSKTNYWTPTLAATGVAVVCAPIAFIDYGFTLSLAPPITSCLLMCSKSSENRRKLGITMPEEADKLMAKFAIF